MSTQLFGTDGIRARVGKHPLNQIALIKLGNALGRWIIEKQASPKILIAHDTRASSYFIKAAIKTGLLPHNVCIDDVDVLPTPAVYFAVTRYAYDLGIMITASHNPASDNGLKFFKPKEGKISAQDESDICKYFDTHLPDITNSSFQPERDTPRVKDEYLAFVQSIFSNKVLSNKKIVIDCAHGAAFSIAPRALSETGATIIPLYNKPNGYNINNECGSTSIKTLKKAVIHHKADLGIALDGDGDRILFVSHNGQIKDGDDLICLLLHHPAYTNETMVVSTIMSNHGFEQYLKHNNKSLIRTSVGDKYVTHTMKQKGILLGGEPSGHIILGDLTSTADGILVALRVLESIMLTDNWNLDTFSKYPQITINLPVTKKKDLEQDPLFSVINASKRELLDGRLIVRYSGTESLLRIMIESQDEQHARKVGTHLLQQLVHTLHKET